MSVVQFYRQDPLPLKLAQTLLPFVSDYRQENTRRAAVDAQLAQLLGDYNLAQQAAERIGSDYKAPDYSDIVRNVTGTPSLEEAQLMRDQAQNALTTLAGKEKEAFWDVMNQPGRFQQFLNLGGQPQKPVTEIRDDLTVAPVRYTPSRRTTGTGWKGATPEQKAERELSYRMRKTGYKPASDQTKQTLQAMSKLDPKKVSEVGLTGNLQQDTQLLYNAYQQKIANAKTLGQRINIAREFHKAQSTMERPFAKMSGKWLADELYGTDIALWTSQLQSSKKGGTQQLYVNLATGEATYDKRIAMDGRDLRHGWFPGTVKNVQKAMDNLQRQLASETSSLNPDRDRINTLQTNLFTLQGRYTPGLHRGTKLINPMQWNPVQVGFVTQKYEKGLENYLD